MNVYLLEAIFYYTSEIIFIVLSNLKDDEEFDILIIESIISE